MPFILSSQQINDSYPTDGLKPHLLSEHEYRLLKADEAVTRESYKVLMETVGTFAALGNAVLMGGKTTALIQRTADNCYKGCDQPLWSTGIDNPCTFSMDWILVLASLTGTRSLMGLKTQAPKPRRQLCVAATCFVTLVALLVLIW